MDLKLTRILFAAVYFSVSSCRVPECQNSVIFRTFTAEKKEYKSELAKQIKSKGTENLSYWYDRYVKRDNGEYILVNVQGKGLCATAEIQVFDWEKLDEMRREVSGYKGAELAGLEFKIIDDSTGVNFVYADVDSVID